MLHKVWDTLNKVPVITVNNLIMKLHGTESVLKNKWFPKRDEVTGEWT